jgi:hypothetical protein
MTVRGEMRLRRTPFELVFGPDRFEVEVFPAISEEAAGRGQLEADPESFAMLGTVGWLLRELRPTESGPGAPENAPPPQAMAEYGALVWHAWHFWRSGQRIYALAEDLARHLLADVERVGPRALRTPAPAGYVQLPRHLLWARVDERSAAEPIDGWHWVWLDAGTASGRARPKLHLLLALGLRPGRGGLGVIDIAATPPDAGDPHWADLDARGDGQDFANILPGGELQGYHGVTAPAEVLKLTARVFAWLDRHPGSIVAVGTATDAETADDSSPASRLPFHWVRRLPGGNA